MKKKEESFERRNWENPTGTQLPASSPWPGPSWAERTCTLPILQLWESASSLAELMVRGYGPDWRSPRSFCGCDWKPEVCWEWALISQPRINYSTTQVDPIVIAGWPSQISGGSLQLSSVRQQQGKGRSGVKSTEEDVPAPEWSTNWDGKRDKEEHLQQTSHQSGNHRPDIHQHNASDSEVSLEQNAWVWGRGERTKV